MKILDLNRLWAAIAAQAHVDWRPFLLPVFLTSPFSIVLIMRFARLTVLRSSVPAGFDEFEEAVLAFGVASFCLLSWRIQNAS